jgi:hypothetical protein
METIDLSFGVAKRAPVIFDTSLVYPLVLLTRYLRDLTGKL